VDRRTRNPPSRPVRPRSGAHRPEQPVKIACYQPVDADPVTLSKVQNVLSRQPSCKGGLRFGKTVDEAPLSPRKVLYLRSAVDKFRVLNARSKQGGEVCPCSSRMHRIPIPA
jgi:hypothetical protein